MSRPKDAAAPNLANRVALSIEEAAAACGLSDGAFRAHVLPHCPTLYAGRLPRIPTSLLLKTLEELALSESQELETAADLLSSEGS